MWVAYSMYCVLSVLRLILLAPYLPCSLSALLFICLGPYQEAGLSEQRVIDSPSPTLFAILLSVLLPPLRPPVPIFFNNYIGFALIQNFAPHPPNVEEP